MSWHVVKSSETDGFFTEDPAKVKSRLNRGISDPEIPFALAITIINFPGFLSFTTCIKDEVAFVFVADFNSSVLSGYVRETFRPANFAALSILSNICRLGDVFSETNSRVAALILFAHRDRMNATHSR